MVASSTGFCGLSGDCEINMMMMMMMMVVSEKNKSTVSLFLLSLLKVVFTNFRQIWRAALAMNAHFTWHVYTHTTLQCYARQNCDKTVWRQQKGFCACLQTWKLKRVVTDFGEILRKNKCCDMEVTGNFFGVLRRRVFRMQWLRIFTRSPITHFYDQCTSTNLFRAPVYHYAFPVMS